MTGKGLSAATLRTDARAQLGLEELPPELEGGEDAEVAFAQGDEGRQQHHHVRSKVVRLEPVELQE